AHATADEHGSVAGGAERARGACDCGPGLCYEGRPHGVRWAAVGHRRSRQADGIILNQNLTTERPTFVTHLECAMMGDRYEADKLHNLSKAGKPLLVRYDLA